MELRRSLSGIVHGLGLGGTLYGSLLALAAASVPVRGNRRATGALVRGVCRLVVPAALRMGGVRVVGRGAERAAELGRGGGYILVANHSSNLDPMVLVTVLDQIGLAFVAKAETLRRPLAGRLLEAVGWIGVERESMAALKKLREEVEARRQAGWVPDLAIFPEGTRSVDGKLGKFQIGPFLLAAQLGLPILPAIIRGAGALHPRNAFAVYPGTIEVEIGEPMFPPSRKLKPLEQVDVAADLMRRTEAMYRAALEPAAVVEVVPAEVAAVEVARAQGAA